MNTQFDKLVEPIKEINELAVKNFETVTDMQLKTAEENARIGIEQIKSAAAVSDAEGWKNYLKIQAEVAQQFNERLLENARSVAELGNAYNNELQRIVKEAFTVK